MEITSITVHQFEIPLEEPFVTAMMPIPSLERVLVEIKTDKGIVGVGEGAPSYEVTGETMGSTADTIETVLAPLILGENPLAIERLVDEMWRIVDGAPSAHLAVETALHDVRGKYAGMPLYELLGGDAVEPVIQCPKVLSIKRPSEMATEAAAAVKEGYDQIKIKVGNDPATDAERILAIADAVPDDMSLKADANQGWRDAKTTMKALADCQDAIDVIEQPVEKSNVDDLAFLRAELPIPVMPDESLESPSDAVDLIKRGAGDVYNIKLAKTGGLLRAAKLNAIAEADDRPTQLGSMVEGHVGTAAGVHFVLAHGNVIWNEMVGPFMTTDGVTDLSYDEPRIKVEGPGLGVTIDQDRLAELTSETAVFD